ncbi:MAG: hypothetical protein NT062_11145 [Proteobacteria bacterium]|nr:hypothetical protein [Pseudomonadota bacterium]
MSSREDWMRRLGPLYGGAVALVHSTPWRWPVAVEDDPSRSPTWIVVLGLPIGGVAWIVAWLFHAVGIPAPIAAIVGMGALVLASAAIVERGLAERIEFWLGHAAGARTRGPIQPGVQTVVALTFVTIVRAATIAVVPVERWLPVFVATAVIGRWAAVFLQAIGDPVPTDDERSLVATPAPMWLTGAISAAIVVLALVALGKVGLVALVLTATAVFGLGLESQRRDGGLTASVVATAAAVGELAIADLQPRAPSW